MRPLPLKLSCSDPVPVPVQCDGYAAYPCFAEARQGAITLAGCWAHVRRGFYEAREESPKVSGWFLRQIQNLYRIESVLRDKKAGPALRQTVRAQQSRPIVERIGRALVRFKAIGRFLPKSLLGEASNLLWANGQSFRST